MVIIVSVLAGLVMGFLAREIVSRRKNFFRSTVSPQGRRVTSLDNKMWYETELEFLIKFNEELSLALDYKEIAACITQAAQSFLPVGHSVLLAPDPDTQGFTVVCTAGWQSDPTQNLTVKKDESITGVVARSREPLVVHDLDSDHYLKKLNREEYLKKAFISVPLIFRNDVLGVLHICDKKSSGGFTRQDVAVAGHIARLGAIALQNSSLYEQVQDEYLKTIAALASAVDARDAYTRFHSENVTRYAVAIAKAMQCRTYEINLIQRAAILHDIGKIGVKDAVLLKNGRLTPEEFEHIKQHSAKGEQIVKILRFLKEEALVIRHHHEKFDGSGYPDGIKGIKIELGARILAAADAFDAMTTERPYHTAMPVEEALRELERNKGIQFDPDVVACLQKIVRENPSLMKP